MLELKCDRRDWGGASRARHRISHDYSIASRVAVLRYSHRSGSARSRNPSTALTEYGGLQWRFIQVALALGRFLWSYCDPATGSRVSVNKQLGKYIPIRTDGGDFRALCVLPATVPAPAVIVLHEIYGINLDIKETCRWIASQGYIALSPDLFWRDAPGLSLSNWTDSELRTGLRLYAAYSRDRGVTDISKTLQVARTLPESSGLVGMMGFCLGGLMAFLATARVGTDASVVYYGGEIDKYVAESRCIKTPLLMHFGEEDACIPADARRLIIESVEENPSVRVFTYPRGMHGFARHQGTHYDLAAAGLANGRTLNFLERHLWQE
jgi:carboxymethylenebutenolidase